MNEKQCCGWNVFFEAYDRERCAKLRGYERDICNWVYNEQRPNWGSADIVRVKEIYGNVPVGTVYRGSRIESEEELQMYQNFSGQNLNLHLASATPHLDEAKSFAWYVKSYDELTLTRMLSFAIKNGSAGKFGGVLLTLAPAPENVVVKTYIEGNEQTTNRNWKKPKSSSEEEVLLHGPVRVTTVRIYERLTLDSYYETLLRTTQTVQDLDNAFTKEWLQHQIQNKKISDNELFELTSLILNKIIKNDDHCAHILQMDAGTTFLRYSDIYKHPKIQRFLRKYTQLNSGRIQIVYNNQKLNVPQKIIQELVPKKSLHQNLKILANNTSAVPPSEWMDFMYRWPNQKVPEQYDDNITIIRAIDADSSLKRAVVGTAWYKSMENYAKEMIGRLKNVTWKDFARSNWKHAADAQTKLERDIDMLTHYYLIPLGNANRFASDAFRIVYKNMSVEGQVDEADRPDMDKIQSVLKRAMELLQRFK